MASGSVDEYTPERQQRLLADVAALAGFESGPPEGSTIRVLPASVRIEIRLALTEALGEFASVTANLTARLATPEAASLALGLAVESVTSVTEVKPVRPPSGGAGDPATSSLGLVLEGGDAPAAALTSDTSGGDAARTAAVVAYAAAAAVAVGLAVLVVIACRRRRAAKRAANTVELTRTNYLNGAVVASPVRLPLAIEPLRTQVHLIGDISSTSVSAMGEDPLPAAREHACSVTSSLAGGFHVQQADPFSGPVPTYATVTAATDGMEAEQEQVVELEFKV